MRRKIKGIGTKRGGGNEPGSDAIDNDLAGRVRRERGELLDNEDLEQFRDVIAVSHFGGAFVVQCGKELAHRCGALGELGNFVEFRGGDGEVRRRAGAGGRGAEFGMQEAGKEGEGNDVGGDGLFVVFGNAEVPGVDAGVEEEDIETGQLGLGSVGESKDGFVRAQVELPDLEGVWCACRAGPDVLCCSLALFDVATGEDNAGGSELDHGAAGF